MLQPYRGVFGQEHNEERNHADACQGSHHRLQGYTINLYQEIEETSGHSVGMHTTGGFYLASNAIWHNYLKRERSKARYMGLDQEFVSVHEAAGTNLMLDPKHFVAALRGPMAA